MQQLHSQDIIFYVNESANQDLQKEKKIQR